MNERAKELLTLIGAMTIMLNSVGVSVDDMLPEEKQTFLNGILDEYEGTFKPLELMTVLLNESVTELQAIVAAEKEAAV